MRFPIAWTILILLAILACEASSQTATRSATAHRYVYVTLNGRVVNGDNGDNVRAYPGQDGADTTGMGIDCDWIAAINQWRFTVPDTSGVWDFYETTGADTAITGLQNVPIHSFRQAVDGQSDTLEVRYIYPYPADGEYTPDDPLTAFGVWTFSDTVYIPNPIDSIWVGHITATENVVFEGDAEVGVNLTAGTGSLNTHQLYGTVQMRNLVADNNVSTVTGTASGDWTVNGTLDANGHTTAETLVLADSLDVGGRLTLRSSTITLAAVRDSVVGSAGTDTVVVPGVADLIAAGYFCHCTAEFNWTLNDYLVVGAVGNQYSRPLAAAPLSQTAATGDSVAYWIIQGPTSGGALTDMWPVVIRCIGVQ